MTGFFFGLLVGGLLVISVLLLCSKPLRVQRMEAWALVLANLSHEDLYYERERVLFRKFHAARVRVLTGLDQMRLDLFAERIDAIDLELQRRDLPLLQSADN